MMRLSDLRCDTYRSSSFSTLIRHRPVWKYPEVKKMTRENSLALLAALGMYFLGQIMVAGAPVTDSSKTSAFAALPAPTGPFAVGKITVHWTDESRIEPLSQNHEPRELMVDIWYPAEPTDGASVAYLDATAYQRALGEEAFRNQFGDASE